MERALAMPGEDDRRIGWRLPHKRVEGGGDIAIGEIERGIGVLAVEQERAISRLAVARRPDLPGAIERARLALDEQSRAPIRIRVERSVPAIGRQISCRVDVENGGRAGLRCNA